MISDEEGKRKIEDWKMRTRSSQAALATATRRRRKKWQGSPQQEKRWAESGSRIGLKKKD